MEMNILTQLDFDVDFISSNTFLERFSQISKVDKVTHHLAQYMIQISMLDQASVCIQSSYLAISSLYLAKKIMKHKQPWDPNLELITRFSEAAVSILS